MKPVKKINDGGDLNAFKRSLAFKYIHATISVVVEASKAIDLPPKTLNDPLITKSNTSSTTNLPPKLQQPIDVSPNGQLVIDVIQDLWNLIDATPPVEGPRRFGNYAYKTWYSNIDLSKLSRLSNDPEILEELQYYLLASFGSPIRLDYGTGHELSFIAFIGILLRLNKLPQNQELLVIFAKYFDLVRRLIIDYSLEPAGSHGVWGLDDHFHFIYILGAAQFNDSTFYPPISSCLQQGVIDEYKMKNLYINGLAFIRRIKTGPFNEHSPILYDIHKSVSLWKKVLSGLLKMYDVEVLGKFPVVQHFYFGKCYPWTDMNGNELPLSQFIDGAPPSIGTAAPWAQSKR